MNLDTLFNLFYNQLTQQDQERINALLNLNTEHLTDVLTLFESEHQHNALQTTSKNAVKLFSTLKKRQNINVFIDMCFSNTVIINNNTCNFRMICQHTFEKKENSDDLLYEKRFLSLEYLIPKMPSAMTYSYVYQNKELKFWNYYLDSKASNNLYSDNKNDDVLTNINLINLFVEKLLYPEEFELETALLYDTNHSNDYIQSLKTLSKNVKKLIQNDKKQNKHGIQP